MSRAEVSRVLMTADAVGGVWTFAVDLARELADAGVGVSLAVLGPLPSPAQQRELAAIAGVSLSSFPGRLEWMEDPWDDVAAAGEWLLDLERRFEPDIVHLNGYCHGALPWRAPVLMTGHSCVLSWWQAVQGTEAPHERMAYAARVRLGLAAARLVTAPSAAMLDSLRRCYGPLPRARVIANGRSIDVPAAPKEPFIFTAGRVWDAGKNVDAVCAAAPRLEWPVYVAGETGEPGRAPQRSGGPCCLGRLPSAEVIGWMARASIYTLPARYEPFGLSILEAALCGCALVVGDIPSLREIWGDAALYVAPDDDAALADALVTLIRFDSYRHRMAGRARARARELTAAAMAQAYRNAYGELAGEVRPLLSLGAV